MTYAHDVVESITSFNVAKALKNLKVQELLHLHAQDELMDEHAVEYEKFVDSYKGDITKATHEEFHEWLKNNYHPVELKESLVKAKAMMANMQSEEACVIPGVATEGDLVLAFITGADAIADSKLDDLLISAVESGEHRTTGFVISDGGDNMEMDIQFTLESKGALDCRELIHQSLLEGCETVQAKSFIFTALTRVEKDDGSSDEILFLYVECADTTKAVRMKKVIRDDEGKIKKFKNVKDDVDPDTIEGYFTNVVQTQTFLN